MRRGTLVSLTRGVGGLALGAFLLYGGMGLERADWGAGAFVAVVGLTLVGAMGAVWSLTHVTASRAAQGLALVLLGLGPASAALGWWLVGAAPVGVLAGVLAVNFAAGVATLILTGWLLAEGAPSRTTRRVTRAG